MSGAFNVSENIGFDGYSYYCRRCGKAGYQKPTQVRGHLALCAGTLARKGIAPTTSYNQLPTLSTGGLAQPAPSQLQPVRGASGGDLGGSQLLQPVAVVGPVDNPLAANYEQLDRRMVAMENEYTHLVQQRNQPVRPEDVFSRYKGLIILGTILLFALILSKESRQCPTAGSTGAGSGSTGRGINFTKLVERGTNKMADMAISKSLGKLFP